jgi:hypothetical protein
MRNSTGTRALIAAAASAAFLWTLALTSSPELHGRIHKDANRPGHTCAITLIASGSYDQSASAPVISASAPAVQFLQNLELNSVWVQPLFFSAHIFAHAPPALG